MNEFIGKLDKERFRFRYYIEDDTGNLRKRDVRLGYATRLEAHETLVAVCQFPGGFYDLDDKEVCEGDIIATANNPEMWGVVKWGDYRFYVDDIESSSLDEYGFYGCIILGNIYENPEMISGGTK